MFNGKLLSFAQATINEVKLTGCTISSSPNANLSTFSSASNAGSEEAAETRPIDSATQPPQTHSSNVRPEGACALPQVSHGHREDSRGIRFGLQPGSRLEFDKVPEAFDNNLEFSIQLRATASNGILMFVTNEKHSDFMVLYMQEGRVFFSFGSGNAKV